MALTLAHPLAANAQPVGGPTDMNEDSPTVEPLTPPAELPGELPPAPVPTSPTRFSEEEDITVGEAIESGYTPRPRDEPAGSLSAGLLAIFPGVLVHGLGHYVADEKGTALKLLLTEVLAIGMIIAGTVGSNATNGAGRTEGALGLLQHYGWALFVASWVADVVGSFKGAESFYASTTRMDGERLRLAYRYTRDPRTVFRHHIFVGLDFDLGWLYIQPEVDLEGALNTRRYQLHLAGRVLRGENPQNNVAVGVRTRRVETPTYGISTIGAAGFVEARGDLGVLVRSLRNFYLFSRAGVGWEGTQIASRVGDTRGIVTAPDINESYLLVETGMSVNSGPRTHVALTVIVDQTLDIAPLGANGVLVDTGLTHRYRENLDIEFHFTAGDAFAVWLGLEYGL